MTERGLKLLVIGLNTAPELVGIGKYTGEMTAWLAARGHDVRVVAAPPYYPEWRIWPGYRQWTFRREAREGVGVLRAPLYVPRRPGGLRRLLHHLSFAATSLVGGLACAVRARPQAVVCVAPSLLSALAALFAARLAGAPAWLHIQDLEVDAAFDLGLLKGSRSRRLALSIERLLLRRFARVSTISQAMVDRVVSKGVPQAQVALLPNWVDCQAVRPMDRATVRQAFGLPQKSILVLYSGNLGRKQGVGVAAELAQRWSDRPDVHFAVFGAGPAKQDLLAAAQRLPNLTVGDLVPVEQLPQLLASADVHLLPQAPQAADLVLPSKLTGMLASGRPVIAAARPETELYRMVEGAGIAVAENTCAAFDSALRRLVDAPELRVEYATVARQRALKTFDKIMVLEALERDLAALARV